MRDQGKVMSLKSLMDLSKDLFRDNRIFVTLDPVDDIEYLLKYGTEDSLMIGTDYSHHDVSANLNAFQEVKEWANDGRIDDSVATKILERNPEAFYGF